MRISDLIADLKDLFADPANDNVAESITQITNRPDLQEVEPETDDQTETSSMVAPLQQKLELLKKAVDVDNYYGDNESTKTKLSSPLNITLNIPTGHSDSTINLTVNGQPIDDLDQIVRLAGVPAAAIFDAGDDEPLDS
jgi:hypothetical protein